MNGVDNLRMGAYRALAQHIYSDFQKGDLAAAAELGRVLETIEGADAAPTPVMVAAVAELQQRVK